MMRPGGRPTSRRLRYLGAAAVAVIALTALLTIALTSVVAPLVAQVVSSTPTTASWIATQEAVLTPTSADWYTLKEWQAGFQVDVPGVIGSSHGFYINDFSGQGTDLYYTGAPISSPLQQREAKIWVEILYSTRITDENICPQGGVAVEIGSGNTRVPAWVRDEGRIVAVNLVLNGTAIQITLDTRDDARHALPMYSDIWQHMLASYAPLPGVPHQTTHPCG